MENIALPSKIELTIGDKPNQALVSIQPCSPGYGTTLGNALRRVLLSSLPGAAVTAFKIKGVSHEFSSVDFVKEDIVEVSLNLKQVRFRMHTDQPTRLTIKAKGQKVVTAKDITKNSEVEVVSPDVVIATLTDKKAEFEMDLIVERGRGYQPVEAIDKDKLEIDMIGLDAIFTPVRNVAFQIENVRVGDRTNFEHLILTIETDGSITPEEALRESTDILLEHFNFIAQNAAAPTRPSGETTEATEAETAEPKPKKRGRPKKEAKDKEAPAEEPAAIDKESTESQDKPEE